MTAYDKPPELYDGLRLHQNEDTGGCSPRVIEALAKLRPEDMAFYPPYTAATRACGQYLGVDPASLALVNGLDEGLMALAVAYLRPPVGGPVPEAIVPEPAFEIFRIDTEAVGGQVVQVMPQPDFSLPLEMVLRAITPRTRVVFLTNPNNPTGVSTPPEAIRQISHRVPKGAVVLVDEAYAEFAGRTFIPELPSHPNVIVGRTFSKAFGLAGIRIGCLVGAADVLDPIRAVVPVYSVNIAAVAAVQAALGDQPHLQEYLRQVKESKALLYAACDRLGLTYWKSDANFVLVGAGERCSALVSGVARRGIYLRDRSGEPGCAGCFRISTGRVEHTRRAIAAIEEVLCGAG